jgi:hypothetical protein
MMKISLIWPFIKRVGSIWPILKKAPLIVKRLPFLKLIPYAAISLLVLGILHYSMLLNSRNATIDALKAAQVNDTNIINGLLIDNKQKLLELNNHETNIAELQKAIFESNKETQLAADKLFEHMSASKQTSAKSNAKVITIMKSPVKRDCDSAMQFLRDQAVEASKW